MRIRQVKPAFFTDQRIAALSDAERLFYIATWMLADDGGYFEWDVPEVAMQVYGYHGRKARERWVEERGAALVATGRLSILGCGHAYVPHLTEHQHFGGRPVRTVTDAHARDCARMRADEPGQAHARGGPGLRADAPDSPQRKGKVGEGKEGNGEGAGRTNGGLTIDEVRAAIADPATSPAVKKAYERALERMESRA